MHMYVFGKQRRWRRGAFSINAHMHTCDGTDSSPATQTHTCKPIYVHVHSLIHKDTHIMMESMGGEGSLPHQDRTILSRFEDNFKHSSQHWLSTAHSFTVWHACITIASDLSKDSKACLRTQALVGCRLYTHAHTITHSANVISHRTKTAECKWELEQSMQKWLHHLKCVCCFEPKGLVGLAFVEQVLDDTKTRQTGEVRNKL